MFLLGLVVTGDNSKNADSMPHPEPRPPGSVGAITALQVPRGAQGRLLTRGHVATGMVERYLGSVLVRCPGPWLLDGVPD